MKTDQDVIAPAKGSGASRLETISIALLTLLLAVTVLSSIVLADSARDGVLRALSFGPLLLVLLVIAWNARRKPLLVFAVILFWLSLQNIILTPLSKLLEPATVRLLIGAKEVFFLLIIMSSFLHFLARLSSRGGAGFSVLWTDLVGASYLAILLVEFIRGHSFPFLARASYLRFFAILPVCYFLGRSLPLEARHLKTVFRLTIGIATFLCLFGFAELFVLGDAFWKRAGIIDFFFAKGTAGWLTTSQYFANWHTWDFGFPLRRMISLVLEPTTLAELIAGATLMAAFSGLFLGLKRELTVLILLAGLILSFGKGGWVIFMVGAFFVLLKERKRMAVVIGTLFLIFGALFILQNVQAGGNVPIHVRGFLEGVRFAAHHPMGIGLGSGGVYSALFGLRQQSQGKESALGSMLVQTGFFGTLIYAIFFLLLIHQLYRLAGARSNRPREEFVTRSARVISGCLAGIFIVTFFSESAVGVIGTGTYMIIAGILNNFYAEKSIFSL
jgi:hypothetical protein